MRQDVPGQAEGIGRIGQRDEAVELNILKPESISAAAAAIKRPERKLRYIGLQPHFECRRTVGSYSHTGGSTDIHCAACCVA